MALHTLNQAPGDINALQRCLNALSQDDALLLIEDGVYAALPAYQQHFFALPEGVQLYVLEPDLIARGLTDKTDAKFNTADDAEFVELACQHDKVISWF